MALRDDVRNLSSVPALRDLEEDALRLIAFSAETRILRTGDVLFRRGEPSDAGYMVLSGTISLDEDDRAATAVRPPTLIGASALIAETRHAATARAQEPTTVLRISRDLFRRVLTEYPDSARRLRRSMASELMGLRQDLAEVRATLLRES